MEKETDIMHLLTEHQFALFIIGAAIMFLLAFGIVILIGRRSERKRQDKSGE